MNQFRIDRTNNVPVSFSGEVIANGTSFTGENVRWTEIRIYRTFANNYVVEITGCTLIENEVERKTVWYASDPTEVIRRLHRRNSEGVEYLTYVALDALEEAVVNDTNFARAYVETIP